MFLDNAKPDADGRHFDRRLVFEKDPANRRINMGNPAQCILHIIPMTVPQIVTNANGPAITHSTDFSLVNASNRRRAKSYHCLQSAWVRYAA
jgi:hypothetical protein